MPRIRRVLRARALSPGCSLSADTLIRWRGSVPVLKFDGKTAGWKVRAICEYD